MELDSERKQNVVDTFSSANNDQDNCGEVNYNINFRDKFDERGFKILKLSVIPESWYYNCLDLPEGYSLSPKQSFHNQEQEAVKDCSSPSPTCEEYEHDSEEEHLTWLLIPDLDRVEDEVWKPSFECHEEEISDKENGINKRRTMKNHYKTSTKRHKDFETKVNLNGDDEGHVADNNENIDYCVDVDAEPNVDCGTRMDDPFQKRLDMEFFKYGDLDISELEDNICITDLCLPEKKVETLNEPLSTVGGEIFMEDEEYDPANPKLDYSCKGFDTSIGYVYFDYELLTAEKIHSMMTEQLNIFRLKVRLNPGMIRQLLDTYEWDSEYLSQAYAEKKDLIYAEAGLNRLAASSFIYNSLETEKKKCPKCNTITPPDELSCMVCGHHLCNNCWRVYLHEQITPEVNVVLYCPIEKCRLMIEDSSIKKYLDDENVLNIYYKNICKEFVEWNPKMRWCLWSECTNAYFLKSDTFYSGPVCTCGWVLDADAETLEEQLDKYE